MGAAIPMPIFSPSDKPDLDVVAEELEVPVVVDVELPVDVEVEAVSPNSEKSEL